MPELFIYLIKVNVALLIFCLGYYLVLRRLTFYTLNRIYLVTAILFSTLYPRIDLTSFLERHQQISKPVQVIAYNWQGQVNQFAQSANQYNKWFWLQLAFWLGVLFLAIRLAIQLVSLYKLHRRSAPAQVQRYVVRTISGNINPFSFWRTIYLNPENHSPVELKAILEHEQIHVNEWHTLDILLGEISTVFYWFNPGIWLMKRAIRENIEFITDRKILQKGMDSKAYQYSLLNVNFGSQQNTIVNNFNISTIKKRIIMMNAKRSSRINVTRYALLLPVVVMLLLVFSVSKAQLASTVKSTVRVVSSLKTAVQDKLADITEPVEALKAAPKAPKLDNANFTSVISDTAKKVKTVIILNEPVQFVQTEIDTNKKSNFRIHPLNDNSDIYVDGKKIAKETLQGFNPNEISQINVLRNNTKTGDIEKGEGYIFITTKAADGDKKTRETMEMLRLSGRLPAMDSIRKTVRARAVYSEGTELTGKVKGQLSNVTIIAGKPRTVDSAITITGNGRFTFTTKTNHKGDSASKDVVVVGYATRPTQVVQGMRLNSQPSVALVDSALKIVDGKEVDTKRLKKVSAADIESVEVLNGDAAIRKYGEKARKGVIIITTKK